MNTLNRVLLIILFALIAVASLVGVLLAVGVLTSAQVLSVLPLRSIEGFFRTNFVAASIISIVLLAIVLALSALWLRAQYSEAVTSVAGGMYGVPEKGPGVTEVNYDAVEHAIDQVIKSVPGVIDSRTRTYAEHEGRLLAHSSLMVKRNADIHTIDNTIRGLINRNWLDKLGINLARHDTTINIEPVEARVA